MFSRHLAFLTSWENPPPEPPCSHFKIKTAFWDVAAPENELDQRLPVFDSKLAHLVGIVRDQSERVIFAKKSAEMAAHVASMASTRTIAKAHQLAREAAVHAREELEEAEDAEEHEFEDDGESLEKLEIEESINCAKNGYCELGVRERQVAKKYDLSLD